MDCCLPSTISSPTCCLAFDKEEGLPQGRLRGGGEVIRLIPRVSGASDRSRERRGYLLDGGLGGGCDHGCGEWVEGPWEIMVGYKR